MKRSKSFTYLFLAHLVSKFRFESKAVSDISEKAEEAEKEEDNEDEDEDEEEEDEEEAE